MSNSLQPHRRQHTRPPCPSLSPRVCLDSCPLSWWCYLTIEFQAIPFFCLQSFLISESFQSVSSSSQVAKVLEFQLQQQFFQWYSGLFPLVWAPCSPRNSQESSPALQFESINSLVLSFLYGPTFIPIWLLEKPQLWLDRPLLTK